LKETKSLLSLTILYTVGNLSSKVISFVLVFFTTFYLTKEDVGAYDLILITLSLLSPFVTFQLTDAALRWLLDNDRGDNSKKVFSTITAIFTASHIVLYVLMFIYDYFYTVKYFNLLFTLVLFQSIYLFLIQCIRGLGKNEVYVGVGLLNTFIYVGLAILALAVFNFRVEGLLYSSIIAGFVTSVVLLFLGKLYTLWDRKSITLEFSKTLLQYSVPLIPNSLSWWAISSANRYIILMYLGAAANGIFAIAFKLPTILLMFVNIFYLAWQEKSILSFEREDRDEYYTIVLKKYIRILFSISILIVASNKILLSYIVSKEFFDAWQYTPLLLLSIILSAIAGFYGTGYLSAKKTRGALTSSLFGGLATVGLSFLLIPKFGLFGASYAIVIGYLVLLVIRTFHMKNIFAIVFPYKLAFFMLFLLALVSLLNYGNIYVLYGNVLLAIILLGMVNKKELIEMKNLIQNKFGR
jgi:O-antigen/teichoic acid export membrane protein